MARRPLKSKPQPKKFNSLKVVKTEAITANDYSYSEPTWREPSAHWLKLDEARLSHWRAKLEGGDVVATLKAWAALLHVPKTRMTNGTV